MHSVAALTPAHFCYLAGVVAIIVTMIFRANVVVPAILATFAVAFAFSGKLLTGFQAIFMGSLTAAHELFNIFLVIALMTALLNGLRELGADVRMVQPFKRIMLNGHVAYFILALITYLISLFFWPTPAVPLVGAILIPAAVYAGLPPLGAAAAIAIAGQGMALSSDYVIKVAPGISAKAAGTDMLSVANMAFTLSLVVGAVSLALTWFFVVRGKVAAPSAANLVAWEALGERVAEAGQEEHQGSFAKAELARGTSGVGDPLPPMQPALSAEPGPSLSFSPDGAAALPLDAIAVAVDRHEMWSKVFAVATPLAFLAVVVVMMSPGMIGSGAIRGGDAAALIGGMAAVLMMLATLSHGRKGFLDRTAEHIIGGFVFAFKAMGAVLPIAGFFFVGDASTAGPILGVAAGAHVPSFLFELVQACSQSIPQSPLFVSFGVLLMGMITGIDGSGFAGLPLTGSLSGALAPMVHMPAATLAAIGQMGAVWTGGGTLVAWSSLIAVAGFARVPVLDAVRALFLPVVCGLVVATLVAVSIS
ncbi:hypothetical protein [Paraburkholderia caballeronis]|uniref:H+/gluconate symporter n=1 Tax=Paraburkholderia caballeronis TaxID=416943 RepID=A0A1H7RTE9_9BURK|nr:hypothetical protein [Paraburkholderia caballeronis]PXW23204.1 hypothetical protein C7403_111186 [Paraburkholderia caballeronis]PXW97868.1 hypothetical protein C7407_111186 [Paraburkholderia caballeronis]RAJ94838.1 hypothetical protein C7409_111186 [Paraburkholderia caballeronis]TDV11657.1 hypothetical protein C7408_11112 [Paraburkholderia caballeronis]TDV14738.1 hypothetical protein C7406_11212 [Paraburkholderia caballeronis]